MSRYQVQTAQLREIAETLRAAVRAADAVVVHPGVVRGRAADAGDDDLRDAAAVFADRWEYGLRQMTVSGRRMADALTLAADTYEGADAAAVPVWARRGEPG